jgi:hypothetical protein
MENSKKWRRKKNKKNRTRNEFETIEIFKRKSYKSPIASYKYLRTRSSCRYTYNINRRTRVERSEVGHDKTFRQTHIITDYDRTYMNIIHIYYTIRTTVIIVAVHIT